MMIPAKPSSSGPSRESQAEQSLEMRLYRTKVVEYSDADEETPHVIVNGASPGFKDHIMDELPEEI